MPVIDSYTYNNFKGFPYREWAYGTPSVSIGQDRANLSRIFFTPWDLQYDLYTKMLGENSYFVFDDLNRQMSFFLPSRSGPHEFPYMRNTYCESIQSSTGVIPAGNDERNVQSYDEARFTASYNSYRYEMCDDATLRMYGIAENFWEASLIRYVDVEIQPRGVYQTIPRAAPIRFCIDGAPLTATAMVILDEADVVMTWKNVDPVCFSLDWINRWFWNSTNADPIGDPFFSQWFFPIGTLIFVGFSMKRIPRPLERWGFLWEISYKFRYMPHGANRFFHWTARATPRPGGDVAREDFVRDPALDEAYHGPGYYLASYDGRAPTYHNAVHKIRLFKYLFCAPVPGGSSHPMP